MTVMTLKPFLLAKWKHFSSVLYMHMEMFLFYFQKLKVKESDVMPFIFSN